MVDFINNLQVTRQQALEERDSPLLECLGQDCVVGVPETEPQFNEMDELYIPQTWDRIHTADMGHSYTYRRHG